MLISKKNCLFLLMAAFLGQAQGSNAFIQFFGSGNASGEVDGVTFSGEDWLLELGMDDSVTDSSTNGDVGQFVNAFTSAALVIGETTYQLSESMTGQVEFLAVSSGGRDTGRISFNPGWGGSLSFTAALSAVKPVFFTDQNLLNSLVVGASIDNSLGDGSSNASVASFQVYDDPPFGSSPGLLGANGEKIALFVNAPIGSGTMSVSSSSLSIVPEPAAFTLLLSLGCFSFLCVSRRT